MKFIKANLVYIIISIILILGIIFAVYSLRGHASKQVKASLDFINKLSEIGAIEKQSMPKATDFKETKIDSNNTSRVKYSLIGNEFCIDLDKDYNVVGFVEKKSNYSKNEAISQSNAVILAKRYLQRIMEDKVDFKDLKNDNSNELDVYNLGFNKIHGNYICYNNEIIVTINKYTEKIVGFSGFIDSGTQYVDTLNISQDRATEISKEYIATISKKNDDKSLIIDHTDLQYVSVSDNTNQLSYVVKIRKENSNAADGMYELIINGDTGEIIKQFTLGQ